MLECFGVFSEVIAFVCIGSQFAAVRTLLPSHRRIAADAASARANEVGEPSIARFAPPTSRRGITEGPELSLSRPDGFSGQPKGRLRFNSSSQSGQTSNPPHAAFVGANHLFAGLVLHQIRPRARSAAAPKQRVSVNPELARRRLGRLAAKKRA